VVLGFANVLYAWKWLARVLLDCAHAENFAVGVRSCAHSRMPGQFNLPYIVIVYEYLNIFSLQPGSA